MTAVTVYTKPACPQCDMTKRELTKLGIEFTAVPMEADADAHAQAMSYGHRSAPVVVAGEQNWGGFRPDMIRGLVAQAAAHA